MIRLFLTSVLFLLLNNTQAQNAVKKPVTAKPASDAGYLIPVTIAPFKNAKIYLGCYYGKYKNLVDSVIVNEQGYGVLKGKDKLPGGIYFMVSP